MRIVVLLITVMMALWVNMLTINATERIDLTAFQVNKYLNNKAYIFIDVRENDEYKKIHIPGSLNYPLSSLNKNYKNLPENKTLIIVCKSGIKSVEAYNFLKDRNYNNLLNLNKGILDWQKSGYKTIKEK